MVIGILQFELFIHGAESIKDKRRVVRSLKDRLHREHLVSIAEVGNSDALGHAVLGLALVGREGKHVAETLDRITSKLQSMTEAEVGDVSRELLHGRSAADFANGIPGDEAEPAAGDQDLAQELLRHAGDPEDSDGADAETGRPH
ncbi:MAG: DUF503 domain-containing protein [Planctomycetota bacterium]|nr:DUF503 domain-containing protein [Planctomycetota bacterium]